MAHYYHKINFNLLLGACADGSEVNNEWKDSVFDAARNLVTAIKNAPNSLPPPDKNMADILLKWLQPVSIFRYISVKCEIKIL